jgi:hypothetical protein
VSGYADSAGPTTHNPGATASGLMIYDSHAERQLDFRKLPVFGVNVEA